MKSTMDTKLHHQCVQRAIELGRSSDPAVLQELARLLKMPSAEIRRLAASAIGKLAGFGADPAAAVASLAPVALHDSHPQVQQAGKKLVSLHASEKHRLRDALRKKLSLQIRLPTYARRLSAPVDTPIPLSSDSETGAGGVA